MSEWYADYLRSDHWKRAREERLVAAEHRCERCGEHARRGLGGRWMGLHVHHRSYERVGTELPDDLEVLCGPCHQENHGLGVADEAAREAHRRSLSKQVAARSTGYVDEIEIELGAWARLVEAEEGGVTPEPEHWRQAEEAA